MADFSEDIWNEDIWSDSGELNEEDVVIPDDDFSSPYHLNFEDDDDFSNYGDDEDEPADIQNLRNDPDVSKWLPSKPTSIASSFSGIFKNEGARTGQPTNLNSSAIGRGQMIKGTRYAMYKKLGITDVDSAEEAFRTDPDFEMQVLNAYKDELDKRIPSNIQGKQREYMIAKGWYTGDPFYDDNKVPGKSAGNRLTAGEYARRAVMQYGGIGPEVYNIPELDGIDGVSNTAIAEYLDAEGIDSNNYTSAPNPVQQDLESNNNLANIVQNVQDGVTKFQQFKNKMNSIGAGAARTIGEAIDFQTEIAAAQRNNITLRKFNERKREKKYSINDTNLNQPLIYT